MTLRLILTVLALWTAGAVVLAAWLARAASVLSRQPSPPEPVQWEVPEDVDGLFAELTR